MWSGSAPPSRHGCSACQARDRCCRAWMPTWCWSIRARIVVSTDCTCPRITARSREWRFAAASRPWFRAGGCSFHRVVGRRGAFRTLYPPAPTEGVSRPIGRRLFLAGLAGGAGLIAFGDGLPSGLRSWLERPLGELSPGDGFHFYSVTGSIPSWDRARWRLTVDGLVDQPLSLGIDDLLAARLQRVKADFHCVSGWSVSGVSWMGVSVPTLLERAGVHPAAHALRFESADGAYVDFLDMATAL